MLFLDTVIVALVRFIRERLLLRKVLKWPRVEGRVQRVEIEDDGWRHFVVLTAAFSLDRREFSSRAQSRPLSRKVAEECADFAERKPIQIRYDPDDPYRNYALFWDNRDLFNFKL